MNIFIRNNSLAFNISLCSANYVIFIAHSDDVSFFIFVRNNSKYLLLTIAYVSVLVIYLLNKKNSILRLNVDLPFKSHFFQAVILLSMIVASDFVGKVDE